MRCRGGGESVCPNLDSAFRTPHSPVPGCELGDVSSAGYSVAGVVHEAGTVGFAIWAGVGHPVGAFGQAQTDVEVGSLDSWIRVQQSPACFKT